MILTVLKMTRNVAKGVMMDITKVIPMVINWVRIIIRNVLKLVWIVIINVNMDFWMVKRDIRIARKVGEVVTVSKNLDFAKRSMRENHLNINRNCGNIIWPRSLVQLPTDCFGS